MWLSPSFFLLHSPPACMSTALRSLRDQLPRAAALDTIGAVLPHHRRDALAAILTDGDVATLRHLVERGLGANTLRAMTSDLVYLDGWCRLATGQELLWPAPVELIMKFIAHHLWDPAKRAETAEHGMPDEVSHALRGEGLLRGAGPHAAATVRRRLALWSTLHRWRGLIGPFADPHVKTALKVAIRSAAKPTSRKSPKALTRDIVDKLVATCGQGRAADIRDHAILLVGFASGGRRRSEIARLSVAQLQRQSPTRIDPNDAQSHTLNCTAIRLGRTKTEDADRAATVLIVGRPADALTQWLAYARITSGPVFRAIDRWGRVGEAALTPEAVNLVIKRRCRLAGLDPAQYSAHGLRAGYLTEAARSGIPLLEAMQQSRHKTVQQAAIYYNEADRASSHAARVLI